MTEKSKLTQKEREQIQERKKEETLKMNRIFSRRVYELMDAKGLYAADLARETGINPATISTYLRPGDTESAESPVTPSLYNAAKIAKCLNVSLEYLSGISSHDNETHDPIAILSALGHAIISSNLRITFEEYGTVSISSRNLCINQFLSAIVAAKDSDVDRIASGYINCKYHNGRLMLDVEYHECKKREYLYKDISQEQLDLYPDECHDEIERRLEIWETLSDDDKYREE